MGRLQRSKRKCIVAVAMWSLFNISITTQILFDDKWPTLTSIRAKEIEKLSGTVKKYWDAATDDMKAVPGEDPKGMPMSVGQLTGKGKDLEFQFASQGRPVNRFNPDAMGKALLDEVHHDQAKVKFPEKWEKAEEAKAKADAATDKAQNHFNKIDQDLKNAKDPKERQKLAKEKKEASDKLKAAKNEAKTEAKARNEMLEKTKHSNGLKCPECKLITDAESKGQRGQLKDSWSLAYGERPGVNGGKWGPQEPCEGRGEGTGCKHIMDKVGQKSLYDTAKQLEEGKHPKDADNCKRGQYMYYSRSHLSIQAESYYRWIKLREEELILEELPQTYIYSSQLPQAFVHPS